MKNYFEDGDDITAHIEHLECPCNPTPFTEETTKLDDKGNWILTRTKCLRHKRFLPRSVLPVIRTSNMQLFDNEGNYKIQDMANHIRGREIKGKYAPETAHLLFEQIEGMYQTADLQRDN